MTPSNHTPRHDPAYFRAFVTSYFTLAAQRVHRMLAPWIFVPLMTTGYVLVSLFILRQTLQEPKGRANLISEDSKHYLQIAADFADGNFSMDYVSRRPHRQPLYSAALAPVIRFKGEDYFWLAVVNIAFATAGFLVAYAAVLHLHASRVIAALVGTLYLTNPFLIAQTTRRLMTEPLHILLMIGMIFALLTYLRDRRPIQLLVVASAAGMDYLTRCNGLFVMLSLGGALAVWELVNVFATRRVGCARSILRKAGLYATALLLFIVITMPSWVPRLQAFGNPVHHGYLSNYLWVDTYKEGHSGKTFANYHFRDYALTHSIGDAARRAFLGLWNVALLFPCGPIYIFRSFSFWLLGAWLSQWCAGQRAIARLPSLQSCNCCRSYGQIYRTPPVGLPMRQRCLSRLPSPHSSVTNCSRWGIPPAFTPKSGSGPPPIKLAERSRSFDADKRGLVVKLRDLKLVEEFAGADGRLRFATTEAFLQGFGLASLGDLTATLSGLSSAAEPLI